MHPDLAGIYCIGGGIRGVAAALRARGLTRQVTLIGHDPSDSTRSLLAQGTLDAVIDQNAALQARSALDLLRAAHRGETLPARGPIHIQAVFYENMPGSQA